MNKFISLLYFSFMLITFAVNLDLTTLEPPLFDEEFPDI